MSEDLEKLYAHYREGDTQFQLAGGVEGITKLSNDFYDVMGKRKESWRILHMHPTDLAVSREKLARFLCGYMNGPELYAEKYGPLALGPAHGHLAIGTSEKEAWLLCMKEALSMQPYPQEFKDFMYLRLCIPAGRIQNRP